MRTRSRISLGNSNHWTKHGRKIFLRPDDCSHCRYGVSGTNPLRMISFSSILFFFCVVRQVGSYVPCQSLKLGMLDGILTRMGGESEFRYAVTTADSDTYYTQHLMSWLEDVLPSWWKCRKRARYCKQRPRKVW
jgi:hypothetical protein